MSSTTKVSITLSVKVLILVLLIACTYQQDTISPEKVQELAHKWNTQASIGAIRDYINEHLVDGTSEGEILRIYSDLGESYYRLIDSPSTTNRVSGKYPGARCYIVDLYRAFGVTSLNRFYCVYHGKLIEVMSTAQV